MYISDPYRWGSYHDDGTGADVYILDTGIKLDHDDFAGRNIEWGFTASVTSGLEDPTADIDGHGTHCAGIAAGNK